MMKNNHMAAGFLAFLVSALICGHKALAQEKTEVSLDQCQEMAMEHNPYILNSQLDILAAQARKREALAEYFPKVSVNALAFYAFDPILEIGLTDIMGDNDFANNLNSLLEGFAAQYGFNTQYSTLKKGMTATVTAMQPVFAGGRIVNGNRLAALGMEAARLKQEIQLRATSEDVEKGYWQVLSLEEKMKTLDQMQGLVDTLYRDVNAAVQAGLATENDLLQVRLKKNELRSGKIRVRNGIRLAKMNLFNSIGLEYNPYSTIRNDSVPYIDDIILSDRLTDLESPDTYYRPEEEVAADLKCRCIRQGISPDCVLVGSDERILNYRHPVPTDKKIEKSLMVVLGGEKYGLNISMTRMVYFAPVPEEIRERYEKTAYIFACMQCMMKEGLSYREYFRKVQELYREAGWDGQWQKHHQGGPTGYACREFIAGPDTEGKMFCGEAFAWNPTIEGTKCEETQ